MPAHFLSLSRPLGRPVRDGLSSLVGRLWRAAALHRQRSRLAHLDDRMLRDIGITRAQAAAEAARPTWDVPPGWRSGGGRTRHD